jgi:hypothetical protein
VTGTLDALYSVRPYLITGGRVAQHSDLPVEAQVVAVGPAADLRRERAAIVRLAVLPLSVAEIAHQLDLQLAVVRVLVSELHASGHLAVHAPVQSGRDIDILRRVVRGLRRLT